MALAKVTVLGFEDYLNRNDEVSLFETIKLPGGIDKDVLKDTILLQCAEFEPLYANPYFFKSAIDLFFSRHYLNFEKWVRGLTVDYNPIENYDRIEEWSDTNSGEKYSSQNGSIVNQRRENSNGSGEIRQNGTLSGQSSNETDSTTETKVSAFDSTSYQPKEQVSLNGSESQTSVNTNESLTKNESSGSVEGHDSSESTTSENEKANSTAEHRGRVHGNIGVTTNMQMQEAYIELYSKYNLYEMIADLFATELCIQVYD